MNYLYQITNLVNNKIYIGVHKTKNYYDNYMGSGTNIIRAIEKYGIGNFSKDILEFFDTYKEAQEREKELVTDEFLLREDVYNLRRGGSGGFDYINKHGLSKGSYNSIAEKNRAIAPRMNPEKYDEKVFEKIRDSHLVAMLLMRTEKRGIFSPDCKKDKSGLLRGPGNEEINKRRSETMRGKYVGKNNSNARSITDNFGNIFDTVNDCASYHNIVHNTVRKRIKSGIYSYTSVKKDK